MKLANELSALYTRDLTRLLQEIRAFPSDESLWQVMPGITNSAGNLVLHLEGNLREYIGRLLGGVAYARNRPLEFSATGFPMEDIIRRTENLLKLIPRVIQTLSSAQMEADYPERVLQVPTSSQQMLIHLHGHVNYHLGQIDYLRRALLSAPAIELAGL